MPRMKKLLISSLLFLGSSKAVEAGPADAERSISFNELEKSYNQAKAGGVPSLVDLAAKRIADTVSICDPAIQDLPWELRDLVAQQWYKKNATRINNLALGQKIPSIKLTGNNRGITSIAILPNGDIVTGSYDGTAIIWDSVTGKEKLKTGHNDSIYAIAILPNGDIVTGFSDGTAIIWDPETGKEKLKLASHAGHHISSIAILPNGDIVTGSKDGTAIIWDPGTGKEKQKLKGHNDGITSIAILPNGDIVTGSYDGTARIWDSETGKEKQKLKGHKAWINAIAILRNGDIVTGSNDKTARIWKISENINNFLSDESGKITLESLCASEKRLKLMRKPKRSNPACAL